MQTGDNRRFLRQHFELNPQHIVQTRGRQAPPPSDGLWVPYIKGGAKLQWFQPLAEVIQWTNGATPLRLNRGASIGNEAIFFRGGVAFSSTGQLFRGRIHRYDSLFDVKGQSALGDQEHWICALLNTTHSAELMRQLNPTISFQVGDAARLPVRKLSHWRQFLPH